MTNQAIIIQIGSCDQNVFTWRNLRQQFRLNAIIGHK